MGDSGFCCGFFSWFVRDLNSCCGFLCFSWDLDSCYDGGKDCTLCVGMEGCGFCSSDEWESDLVEALSGTLLDSDFGCGSFGILDEVQVSGNSGEEVFISRDFIQH